MNQASALRSVTLVLCLIAAFSRAHGGEPDDLLLLAGHGLETGARVAYQRVHDSTQPLVAPLVLPAVELGTQGVAVVDSTHGAISSAADSRRPLDLPQAAGAQTLLMTYHIQPAHLSAGLFQETALEPGSVFVENHETFAERARGLPQDTYLLHDGWHPNADGYRIIATNVLAAIERNELLEPGEAAHRSDLGPR